MALNVIIDEVTVIGFANKALGDRGFELSRPISVKNDAGHWEETGRNYFKVWIAPENLAIEIGSSQQVVVVGRLKIFETEYEGKTRIEMHITAKTAKPYKSHVDAVEARKEAAEAPF